MHSSGVGCGSRQPTIKRRNQSTRSDSPSSSSLDTSPSSCWIMEFLSFISFVFLLTSRLGILIFHVFTLPLNTCSISSHHSSALFLLLRSEYPSCYALCSSLLTTTSLFSLDVVLGTNLSFVSSSEDLFSPDVVLVFNRLWARPRCRFQIYPQPRIYALLPAPSSAPLPQILLPIMSSDTGGRGGHTWQVHYEFVESF